MDWTVCSVQCSILSFNSSIAYISRSQGQSHQTFYDFVISRWFVWCVVSSGHRNRNSLPNTFHISNITKQQVGEIESVDRLKIDGKVICFRCFCRCCRGWCHTVSNISMMQRIDLCVSIFFLFCQRLCPHSQELETWICNFFFYADIYPAKFVTIFTFSVYKSICLECDSHTSQPFSSCANLFYLKAMKPSPNYLLLARLFAVAIWLASSGRLLQFCMWMFGFRIKKCLCRVPCAACRMSLCRRTSFRQNVSTCCWCFHCLRYNSFPVLPNPHMTTAGCNRSWLLFTHRLWISNFK